MIRGVTQGRQGHHGVGHGREDRAEAVLAVQPRGDEPGRQADRARAPPLGPARLDQAQQPVDRHEQPAPARAGRVGDVAALGEGRREEQLGDADPARIARARLGRHQDQQRHDHGPRPVGHLVEVEREPARQQHDLDRHHRHRAPGHLAEQRERDPGEHVAARRPALREDRRPRAAHVRRLGIVADQLQRVVGLDRRAEVALAAGIERPAAVSTLPGAQIDPDPALERVVDVAEKMLVENVFRRDRRVGLELEDPVPVGALQLHEAAPGIVDRLGQAPGRQLGRIEAARHLGRAPRLGHAFAQARSLRRLDHSTPYNDHPTGHAVSTKAPRRQGNRCRSRVERVASCCAHASAVGTRPFQRPPTPRRWRTAESTVIATNSSAASGRLGSQTHGRPYQRVIGR